MSSLPVPINWVLSLQQKGPAEPLPLFVLVKNTEDEEPTVWFYRGWTDAGIGLDYHMRAFELDYDGTMLATDWNWLTLQWKIKNGSPHLEVGLDSEVDGFSFNALQVAASDWDEEIVEYWEAYTTLPERWAAQIGLQNPPTPTQPQRAEVNLPQLFAAPWELVKDTILPLGLDAGWETKYETESVDGESNCNRLTNYQIVINAWGADSDKHDFFLYVLPNH